MRNPVFIIAEAGVNHNGSRELMHALVDHAADAGADAVKFQTFSTDALVTKTAGKAAYQNRATGGDGSQYEMLRRLELSEDDHREIIAHCARRNIQFLSTPFDLKSLAVLADRFGLPQIKLGSGEITNGPLLLAAARTGRRLVVSTGMATLEEVRAALGVLAFGYLNDGSAPGTQAFARAFENPSARAMLADKVILLHCTTEYPAPFEDVNLRAMATLRDAFGVPVGYSDHTPGISIPIAAVAMGAVAIEKHFTVDRSLPGPDHLASLEPAELVEMVAGIRHVEAALGDGIKAPQASERGNMPVARKSIVAATAIAEGEVFTEANLAVKRPGTGMSPMEIWNIVGARARRRYAQDDPIEP